MSLMLPLPFLSPLIKTIPLTFFKQNKSSMVDAGQGGILSHSLPNDGFSRTCGYRCKWNSCLWNTCLQVVTAKQSPSFRLLASPGITAQRKPQGRLTTFHAFNNKDWSPDHHWEYKGNIYLLGLTDLFFLRPLQLPVTQEVGEVSSILHLCFLGICNFIFAFPYGPVPSRPHPPTPSSDPTALPSFLGCFTSPLEEAPL